MHIEHSTSMERKRGVSPPSLSLILANTDYAVDPDTPFEQIVEALKSDFEEAKAVSPDPVKLERMWMLAWLEQGGRPAERYPSEGIQAARGSVNSVAEGFFKSVSY
jgi:hypothetical protein